jgi:hypothetical protein
MTVSLKASMQLTPTGGLAIRARIENASAADILVLDRLWKLDKSNQKALDLELAYRFEREGSLRVLLGAAPLPRAKNVTYRNVPWATRVPAGRALERELILAPPIKEYSIYFPEVDPERYETKAITAAHLIIDYLAVTDKLTLRPSSADPSAVEIDNPVFALAAAERLVYREAVEGLAVKRRTDTFDRLVLAGESQEPMVMALA